MELASCTLALGGDAGQTVQKFNVTPSEVAVLRYIHGQDSVTDLQILGTVDRKHPRERARLVQEYGRGMDGVIKSPAVDALFPGVAARLFETFSEIEMFEIDDETDFTGEVVKPIDEPEVVQAPVKAKAEKAKAEKAKAEKAPAPVVDIEETPETAFG
jgi:hypothetical protein